MYIKRLSFYLVLAITIYGCIQPPKKEFRVNSFYAAPTVALAAPKSYTLTETFETGKKATYIAADIQLSTGNWNFNDAIIGNKKTDSKIGEASARLRNGTITMNFDVYDVNQIKNRFF